ncbi:sugar ABC transporter permease [Paenibacillus baekrokdamisoli]|uniref:Sugar ABC transporter permease n=1 Tax=Paenibacillus baekrokdamisoli TaxID=1712516 RepID=A0A3G9J9R4_9BACL|nr:carbohydrate ABC transporter permease [Paenibacillus baekrokdamisoli]MBB3067098.1 putative chitobiose transport system permease protein [Paenibacillus baekrokdamisoli]BBH19709.1 sugar ABC transporter permease [Paenibacillus baekrokdamisoli]
MNNGIRPIPTRSRPFNYHTLTTARMWKKIGSILVLYSLLIITALFCLGPFLWLLSTAFKTGENVYTFPPQFIPNPISFKNFIDVFDIMPLWKYIYNTIYMTVLGVGLNLLLCTFTAYPLARIQFPGRNFIFKAIVSTMILPNAAGMIVNFIIIQKMGLYNNMLGVVLPSAISVFNIFLLRQAFITIPIDMEQSARIDGAREFRIFYSIMLPMIRPAVATVVIFDFMAFWNSLIWPVIVFDDQDKYPLAPALQYLQGSLSFNFPYIASGTIISIIPIIIIFLVLQKQFINGMVGAVKG